MSEFIELRRPVLALPGLPVVLRPFTLADAPALVRHGNDQSIAQNMRDVFPHPYTTESAERYLNFVASEQGMKDATLCIEVEGEAAGSISLLFKHDISRRSAEIGYWLGRAHWGKGYGTAAVRALTNYGFAQFDLARIYAVVFAHNAASGRVLEKAGYELEARLRQAVTKNNQTFDGLLYAVVSAS
jgi:RimJ/RimL family protein N-acetyltransferase